MRSLRVSISLALIAMLTIIGLSASVLSYRFASFEAGQFMDDQMRQLAAVVDEHTRVGKVSALQEPEDRFAVTLWKADGQRVVLAEPDLFEEPPQRGFAVIELGGIAWRTFVAPGPSGQVVIAQRMSAREEVAQHSALEVALPILAMIPLACLIVAAIVSRMLGQLASVGRRVAEQSADATTPVPTAAVPSEMLPFVDAINGLIGRLGTALAQQRRFVADSAHQLRTPLAALTLQVGNLNTRGGNADAPLAALQEGTARVTATLGQLLLMARFDAGAAAIPPERLGLREIATQCIADHMDLAEAAGVDLGLACAEDAEVTMIRSDLTILLANVLDNAIRYTPKGGSVDVMISRAADGRPTVVIVDTGPGVRDDDLPHLTERFFRAADASSDGSGLGLAIVKAIADRYRLELIFENAPDQGLRVVMQFEQGPVPVVSDCSSDPSFVAQKVSKQRRFPGPG